ncbi:MAG: HEAT repeat domain-containing protein, partial [Candidatus Omnitrophota bacterium]
VRCNAASAFIFLKDPKAVEPLIIALKDENEEVRGEAAFALRKINDPRAAEAFCTALNDTNEGVLIHATRSLGTMADS